jgi:hypothetical protein
MTMMLMHEDGHGDGDDYDGDDAHDGDDTA